MQGQRLRRHRRVEGGAPGWSMRDTLRRQVRREPGQHLRFHGRLEDRTDGRVMVLVAHADDESVAYGALLQRMREAVVVIATDGAPQDSYFWGRFGSGEAMGGASGGGSAGDGAGRGARAGAAGGRGRAAGGSAAVSESGGGLWAAGEAGRAGEAGGDCHAGI